ncbi:MAG: MBL fold metallo-hydrolase, partial [Rubrivivax sp.]
MKTTKRVPPAPNLACAFVYPCALACAFGLTLAVTGCGRKADTVAPAAGDATSATASANAAFAQTLPLDAPQDFEDAKRGLVARPEGQVLGADGSVLVDFDAFKFVDGAAPPTVNPSLWRHARLNAQVGLFKVTDGVYQLRGFDIANITLVEGKSGWIVIDALTCRETAAAAMAFARKHLGAKTVSALLFTHSHVDHFGGALGVITAEEQAARKVPVIA